MTAVIRLHEWQGSPEWKEYRSRMGNASELAALMDCSPWFPHTPYELWLLKTGREERDNETAAMRRGRALEPKARAFIEQAFEEVFEPQVVARDRVSASVDGLTFDGNWLLEIKCPAQGRESELWKHVKQHDAPPEHYWWQVQQSLYCAGASKARFVVCHADGEEITDYVGCEVEPDPAAHKVLKEAWERFFEHLDQDLAPPLTERDIEERTDAAWRDAVSSWREARMWLEEAKRAEAEARAALIKASGGRNAKGAGVKLTRYYKRGEVDWKQATVDLDVDIERYRKDGGWQYRISEQE
jgi:putative phage-type endonuclease